MACPAKTLAFTAYSTWKCLDGVTVCDNKTRSNEREPMRDVQFEKGTELQWKEIDSGHRKSPPNPGRKMVLPSPSFSTWLNHTTTLECELKNLRDQSAAVQKSKPAGMFCLHVHQSLKHWRQESGDERSSSFLALQVTDTIRKSSTGDSCWNCPVTFLFTAADWQVCGKRLADRIWDWQGFTDTCEKKVEKRPEGGWNDVGEENVYDNSSSGTVLSSFSCTSIVVIT